MEIQFIVVGYYPEGLMSMLFVVIVYTIFAGN